MFLKLVDLHENVMRGGFQVRFIFRGAADQDPGRILTVVILGDKALFIMLVFSG